jgi:hypothetical protein
METQNAGAILSFAISSLHQNVWNTGLCCSCAKLFGTVLAVRLQFDIVQMIITLNSKVRPFVTIIKKGRLDTHANLGLYHKYEEQE